ncbi:MAG: hypothetical protein H6708_31635 [Kofleriaceae bacterium]|nr:hypothetical protein [Kofleriaceae bacterium]
MDLLNTASDFLFGPEPTVPDPARRPVAPGNAAEAADIATRERGDGVLGWMGNVADGLGHEGLLETLMDPAGVADRAAARRELAGRFDVRDPDGLMCSDDDPGAEAENVVSPEEYERIVHEYSDIRMGRSDIAFNTEGLSDDEAAAFRQDSMNDIASIMQTSGGRTLIDDLAHNEHDTTPDGVDNPTHRTTTLSPLFNTNSSGNYDPTLGRTNTNGFAAPIDGAHQSDGVGTDSRVRFNPGDTPIAPNNYDGAQDEWLPWRSDVLLYHELVHSRDQTRGTFDASPVAAGDGGDPFDLGLDSRGNPLRRGEHRAAGLGMYADEPISENAYRTARRGISVGARDGDATMPNRDTYYYHSGSTNPPPGP